MTSGTPTRLAYPIVEHTLANGLRVVASPDHGAPSVAVNLWYDVGSRRRGDGPDRLRASFRAPDVPGLGQCRLGPAHRAAAVRRRVGERHDLVRSHQLLRGTAHRRSRSRAVAGGRPARHPAGHDDPGEPGQPARGGEGGEAPALRQRSVRQRDGAAERADLPGRPPIRAHHDRLDGRPQCRHPGRRAAVLPDPLRAGQRGAVDCRRRRARGCLRPRGHLLRPPGRRCQTRTGHARAAPAADRDGTPGDLGQGAGRCDLPGLATARPGTPGRSTPSTWPRACSATGRRRDCTSNWSAAPSTPRARRPRAWG